MSLTTKSYPQDVITVYKRVAAISIPIMGLYSVFPVLLFVGIPKIKALEGSWDWTLAAIGITMVMINLLIMWIININLWKLEKRGKIGNQWYNHRILLSFVGVTLLILFMVIVGPEIRPKQVAELPRIYPTVANIANNSVILLLMTLFESQREKAELLLQKTQIEKDHIQSLQDQWKQQIHPHFLFNSLATLQWLIDEDTEQARNYTELLSSYLRTSLESGKSNLVNIETEIELLQKYIQLQQLRFGQAIQLNIHKIDKLQLVQLPVFALQILAENAIKHNSFSKSDPLNIEVRQEESQLVVSNTMKSKSTANHSLGIGLKNLGDRYVNLGSQAPVVSKDENFFTVKLQLFQA